MGKVLRRERRRHGLHFRRNADDKVYSDVLILARDDGELVADGELSDVAQRRLTAADPTALQKFNAKVAAVKQIASSTTAWPVKLATAPDSPSAVSAATSALRSKSPRCTRTSIFISTARDRGKESHFVVRADLGVVVLEHFQLPRGAGEPRGRSHGTPIGDCASRGGL